MNDNNLTETQIKNELLRRLMTSGSMLSQNPDFYEEIEDDHGTCGHGCGHNHDEDDE